MAEIPSHFICSFQSTTQPPHSPTASQLHGLSTCLSLLDPTAPHPQQRRVLLPPVSLECVEKGGEAQKGKEKARDCCSCHCWAPASGRHLQSLSVQVLVLCGHLGHPRSREKAKSQQNKKKPTPFTTEKVKKQLHLQTVFFGVLAPSRGSATDRAEGHRPSRIPCNTFLLTGRLGSPPTPARYEAAFGC